MAVTRPVNAAELDDGVDLGPVLRAEVVQRTLPEVLEPLPQLQDDPLLEESSGVRKISIRAGSHAARREPDSKVEEVKPGG
jgi:hypothetical protein